MEPVYTYRKGIGWVPSLVASKSVLIGKYLVTGYDRKPEIGEYFWTGDYAYNIDYVSQASFWQRHFELDDVTTGFEYLTEYNQSSYGHLDKFTVVSFERISL